METSFRQSQQKENNSSFIEDIVAMSMRNGVKLNKIPDYLKSCGYSEEAIAQLAPIVRIGIVEKSKNIKLPHLRDIAMLAPELQNMHAEFKEYKNENHVGFGIFVEGELSCMHINVLDSKNFIKESFVLNDCFIPMEPKRLGVAKGTGFGMSILNRAIELGSRLEVFVSDTSFIARSPTFRFNTKEEASSAIDLINSIKDELISCGSENMKNFYGNLEEVHIASAEVDGYTELSVNFIYAMHGSLLGHEQATAITGLLAEKIAKRLIDSKINAQQMALAGGEDGDLRPSPKNVRGRRVSASILIPETVLLEFIHKRSKGDPISEEGVAKSFASRNKSKYWVWNDYSGSYTHTGMELEVLDAIFSVLKPPSPPFVSSNIDVKVEEVEDEKAAKGIHYTIEMKNFEYGSEGIITGIRKDAEAIIGLDDTIGNDNPKNSFIAAGVIAAACMAAGLNQHLLMHINGLAKTKEQSLILRR
ncbi:MAG: hypothetical protein QXR73_00015 [Candidatus Micrarchaeaceae archaeon]